MTVFITFKQRAWNVAGSYKLSLEFGVRGANTGEGSNATQHSYLTVSTRTDVYASTPGLRVVKFLKAQLAHTTSKKVSNQ